MTVNMSVCYAMCSQHFTDITDATRYMSRWFSVVLCLKYFTFKLLVTEHPVEMIPSYCFSENIRSIHRIDSSSILKENCTRRWSHKLSFVKYAVF